MFRSLLRSQLVFDVVVAALVALFAVVAGRFDGGGIVIAVGFGIALAFRRLAPGLALTIAWAFALVQMFSGQTVDIADLMIPGVVYATAAYGSDRVRTAGLVSAIVGSVVGALYLMIKEYLQRYDLAGSLIDNPSQLLREAVQGVAYFIVIVAILVLPWLAGLVVRTRGAARMSREAQLLAERDAARSDRAVAVEQERVRIARDMHDIVAHSLAVVIAQADGARYALRASPQNADAALTTIGTTARRALSDVRDLLSALRHEQGTAPTPDIDDIELLVGEMRGVGLDVRLERSGDPGHLPTTSQLAVYRIVQECLTNALKHGDADDPVQLRLDYRTDHVAITVANRRAGTGQFDRGMIDRGMAGLGTGHGLVGMRERAALSGGSMSAGIRGDDFRVEVRIPITTVPAAVGRTQEPETA
ncbi:sensor histidine kinase [Curtobacterium sp. RRHDQ10]|uniref:sensor histidine kinase n=1 Tax=Curtobacterium phyllosphaerae TaxID=3413379 RepID=UPI003BF375FD